MALENTWVGYIQRSYLQIKNAILLKFPQEVPELTDHTDNNIFVRMVGVWAGLTEQLGYYIDNAAKETFLSTAQKYESAIKIAKTFDYRIRGIKSATADVTFTLLNPMSVDYLIPSRTKVSTVDGIPFITISDQVILAGNTEKVIPCKQEVLVSTELLGTSNGLKNQKFELTNNIVDKSVQIIINSEAWIFQETLAYSNSTDKHYTTSTNEDGNLEIIFGDNIQGRIPANTIQIFVSYSTSSGSLGNLAEHSITILTTNLTFPETNSITVDNLNRASGGADLESLADLKKRIPLSIRTLNRAVTWQDYQDIAELQPGVESAGVVFKCGKTVDVYIVPEGGGIASETLLEEVRDAYYDETRMVTTQVRVLAAGEIALKIQIELKVLNTFNKTVTENLVKSNLIQYVNQTNRKVSGSIEIGNLYEIVENTRGVQHSKISLIQALPYARISSGISVLDWTRILKPGSTTNTRWEIKVNSTGEYELTKNGIYAGTHTIGTLINLPEIEFTVNPQSYLVGDSWEFYTYPYNDSIQLEEPSVFALYNTNIQINSTGGF